MRFYKFIFVLIILICAFFIISCSSEVTETAGWYIPKGEGAYIVLPDLQGEAIKAQFRKDGYKEVVYKTKPVGGNMAKHLVWMTEKDYTNGGSEWILTDTTIKYAAMPLMAKGKEGPRALRLFWTEDDGIVKNAIYGGIEAKILSKEWVKYKKGEKAVILNTKDQTTFKEDVASLKIKMSITNKSQKKIGLDPMPVLTGDDKVWIERLIKDSDQESETKPIASGDLLSSSMSPVGLIRLGIVPGETVTLSLSTQLMPLSSLKRFKNLHVTDVKLGWQWEVKLKN
ncbi:MAG: hypothetical protein FP816_09480 [Desulfobacteraceae bacterium]|nr:hypothetical protein [Desulfobacteraceae bacterium]